MFAIRNYDSLTYSLTGVKCRTTSVANNKNHDCIKPLIDNFSFLNFSRFCGVTMEVMLVAPYSKARKKSPYVTRSLCLTLKQPLKSASMQPADRNKFYYWKFYSTILGSLMTTWKILLLAFLTLTRYLSLSDIRQISTCGVRTPKSQLMLKIYFNNIFGKASFQWWNCECSVKYKKGSIFTVHRPEWKFYGSNFSEWSPIFQSHALRGNH